MQSIVNKYVIVSSAAFFVFCIFSGCSNTLQSERDERVRVDGKEPLTVMTPEELAAAQKKQSVKKQNDAALQDFLKNWDGKSDVGNSNLSIITIPEEE